MPEHFKIYFMGLSAQDALTFLDYLDSVDVATWIDELWEQRTDAVQLRLAEHHGE